MIANTNQTTSHRFVIPRWLDYPTAMATGELSLAGDVYIPPNKNFPLDFERFRQSPDVGSAADLLGVAFLEDRPEKIELARFLAVAGNVAVPTRNFARKIISADATVAQPDSSKSLSQQISALRRSLREQPRNPTKWVDLSRLYAANGIDKKALTCLRTALALAPEDRFVIRAFSRFCIHTNAPEDALKIFRKNRGLLKDPWIMATAESLSKIGEKPSPLPRSISTESCSLEHSFHYSELREAFAMAEYMHGKERRAKQTFRAAWICPSQNVVRHAEWVTRYDLPALRGETELKFHESHEAAARAAFKEGEFPEALRQCELWRFEEPYSTGPLAFESSVLCVLEQFEQVVICFNKAKDRRLVSFDLFNNFLFASLMQGEHELGEDLLTHSASQIPANQSHFIVANQGLLSLVRGDSEHARTCYEKAERLAKEHDAGVADRVFLHRCRSFLKFGFVITDRDQKRVNELKKSVLDSDLQALIRNIEKGLIALPPQKEDKTANKEETK